MEIVKSDVIKQAMMGLLMVVMIFTSSATSLAGRVKGYYRKNGTYVSPHYRRNPGSGGSRITGYGNDVNPYVTPEPESTPTPEPSPTPPKNNDTVIDSNNAGETISFTTKNGRKFINATVSRVDPTGITIFTDDGVEKIEASNLPDEILKKYNINAVKK